MVSAAEWERRFSMRLAALAPGAEGYRSALARGETDRLLRKGAAASLDDLRGRIGALMDAARDEGEEDMLDDLDRIRERMERTARALQEADYSGTPFFSEGEIRDEDLERIHAYDAELLADLELLANDVRALRYETIGNLTLREVEGTLAAIELKVTNRGDIFRIPETR